jgi:hypothetical protein
MNEYDIVPGLEVDEESNLIEDIMLGESEPLYLNQAINDSN